MHSLFTVPKGYIKMLIFFISYQEPLLKIEINNPALLAGNWSQLCATCKVPLTADFCSLYMIILLQFLSLFPNMIC